MFQSSVDTCLLADALAKIEIGGTVSYAELGDIIKADVRSGHGYACLRSARHRLQRERQIVFAVIRGEGLRRMSDEQIVEASSGYVDRVRRSARRGARLVTSVADFKALPPHAQVRHNATLSVFSAIEAISSGRAVRSIAATGAAKPLPIAATLEAFRDMIGGKGDA